MNTYILTQDLLDTYQSMSEFHAIDVAGGAADLFGHAVLSRPAISSGCESAMPISGRNKRQ